MIGARLRAISVISQDGSDDNLVVEKSIALQGILRALDVPAEESAKLLTPENTVKFVQLVDAIHAATHAQLIIAESTASVVEMVQNDLDAAASDISMTDALDLLRGGKS